MGLKPFQPGERPVGRSKGTPNKVTKALKDMILGALGDAGGQDYLARQAKENPAAFMTLIGKVLPIDVNAKGDMRIVIETGVPRDADDQG